LAGWRSSPGCDARSEARTQGAPIAEAIGATEDAAFGTSSAGPAAQPLFRQTLLVDVLVGGERQELDEVVAERHLLEE
jgi:hypothetical protein